MRLKGLMNQETQKGPVGFVETEAGDRGCLRGVGAGGKAEASLEQVEE